MFELLGTLLVGVLAQLVPVQPHLHPDDFISISCPMANHCLLLDSAGGLYVWQPAEAHRRLVSSLADARIFKIRFSGTLHGFGLDDRGGLWKTRDGGRLFQPARVPDGVLVTSMELAPSGALWLGTLDGRLLKSSATGFITVQQLSQRISALSIAGKHVLAVTASDAAWLLEDGSNPRKIGLPAGRLMRLIVTPSGQLVASGCQGRILLSPDQGQTWSDLGARLKQLDANWATACVEPLGLSRTGQVLLRGIPGELLTLHPESGGLALVKASAAGQWIDAGWAGDQPYLTGEAGTLARFVESEPGRPGIQMFEFPGAGTADLRIQGNDQAWLVTTDGRLSFSTDGGKHFEVRAAPGATFFRATFPAGRCGFALADRQTIATTDDAGASWKTSGHWPELSLRDIESQSCQSARAIGDGGIMVSTIDGGRNWTLTRLAGTRNLRRIRFVDEQHGWIVGDGETVLVTDNGGAAWTKTRSGHTALFCQCFVDQKTGWVAGDAGRVLHTTDGGQTWQVQKLPTAEAIQAIAFTDDQRGLAGGEAGMLYRTTDAGRNWTRVDLHTRVVINRLACYRGTGHCLIAGQRGLLLVGDPFRLYP